MPTNRRKAAKSSPSLRLGSSPSTLSSRRTSSSSAAVTKNQTRRRPRQLTSIPETPQKKTNTREGVTKTTRKTKSKSKPIQKRSLGTKPSNKSNPKSSTRTKQTKKKRYRRVKVLRWWVIPSIFFVPLCVLLLEYYLGKLISLDDVKDAYYVQLGIDPWDIADAPLSERLGVPPSILNITYTNTLECPGGHRRMINLHNPNSHSVEHRKIPLILHQHSKSRCLTRTFYQSAVKWASTVKRWSYYFHDDGAVDKLLSRYYPEFPLLNSISMNCIKLQTTRFELWSFLNLWVFGGLYVDLNMVPTAFDRTNTILPNEDGFFFIDPETKMLSTKIMAVSPRHPILFFAIQRMLNDVLTSTQQSSNNHTVGSIALAQAFQTFRTDGGNAVAEGLYEGVLKRSIRIVGYLGRKPSLVSPVFSSRSELDKEYREMGVSIMEDTGETTNCFHELYRKTHRNVK